MSSKISKYDAANIAEKISNKAFEHLIGPAQAEANAVAKKAYDILIEGIGGETVVAKLLAHECIERATTCSIEINNGQGNEIVIQYKVENETLAVLGRRWNTPVIVNGPLLEEARQAYAKVNGLEFKRGELNATIRSQIQGKSPASVVKAWPEAGAIIESVVGSVGSSTLVTPLENLLARFLPMLPAPTEA